MSMTQHQRIWPRAERIIAAALEQMRLPAGYWQHTLPPVVQDWLRRASGMAVRSQRLDAFDALYARLDDEAPRWQQAAAQFLLGPATVSALALWRPVAALLASRPLERADALLDCVQRWVEAEARGADIGWSEQHRAAQCVLALFGTDTTATLALWRDGLRSLCASTARRRGEPTAHPALFLLFVKALQHRLLSYDEFAQAARLGQVFDPCHYSGRRAQPPFYHPVLDYLGLTASRYFRLMYQRLAHEQMDSERAGRWQDIWWLRLLRGQDYFFRALEELESDPTSLRALHAAKWAFDYGERGEPLSRHLAAFSPRTLAAVSLLRSDLDRELGAALEVEAHPRAMAWLRASAPAAWALALDAPQWLLDWCARCGEVMTEAVEKLWLLGLPPMASAALLEMLRRDAPQSEAAQADAERYALVERFVSTHLCPAFARISANLDYADALAGRNEQGLLRRARDEALTAIRALGLPGGDDVARVEALVALKRRAGRAGRAAAQEALALIARRHGLPDAAELERRHELALAWGGDYAQDAALNLWWQIGDYRVRLCCAEGRARVIAYGARGPLKSLPAAVRRHPDFQDVGAARRELVRQYDEFRKRLEESMVTGRTYAPAELTMLRSSPVFDDLIGRVVLWVGERAALGRGEVSQPARIAHPVELLAAGELEAWQRAIVDARMVQPFKQCFREVYQPLPPETQADHSMRFAGYPVLVPRAFALLRSRGYSPGRGVARRDWPHAAIQAQFTWGCDRPRLDYHLGDEGRAEPVMTGDIRFYRLSADGKRGEVLPIGQVPPVVYSETMRDADLVVSLAAAGELGFTSEQTIHIRLALVRHLARILGRHNIASPETGSHVIVQGQLATYRVHLGSGSVFLEPTGAHLPPPRAPDSAAEYLPVEELDSRTAEVLRVVLALSRDTDIEDERFRQSLARLAEAARRGG